jgi:arylsulfatase A-like enzyme
MTNGDEGVAVTERGRWAARAVARRGVATVLAALFVGACGRGEHPLRRVERGEAKVTGRGVLVITLDGLRYDRTSLGRTDRDTTPFLRQLAQEGVEFRDTWSTMPARFDAHVSLLTGCDPIIGRRPPLPSLGDASKVVDLPLVVPQRAPSLAVRFLAGGWTTAAFVDHPELTRIRGLDRGFHEFFEYAGRGHHDDHRGEGVFGVGGRFVEWLNRRALDEDWFAYLHMGDLERVFEHPAPFVPQGWTPDPARDIRLPVSRVEPVFHALPFSRVPEGSASLADLELRYDIALLALDASLRRVVHHVDEFGRRANVTIVVLGSYGMPFGESGLYLRPGLPDAPDLRVPWVIRLPSTGPDSVGRAVDGLASLLDVAPTLLELADLPVLEDLMGFSRAAEIRDPNAPSPRGTLIARGNVGGGAAVVTEDAHWITVQPQRFADPLAESWSGRRVAEPLHAVVALGVRRGPRAFESLELPRAKAPDDAESARFADVAGRWQSATEVLRDTLHFGGARSASELAEELRAIQAVAP